MMGAMLRALGALTLTVVLAGCPDSGQAAPAPPAMTIGWTVAVDLSGSRHPAEVQTAQDLVSTLRESAHNGDRVTVIRVFQDGLANNSFTWTQDIPRAANPEKPTPSESMRVERFGRALSAELPVIFDPAVACKINGTDLFATLYRVSDLVHADPSRQQRLLIISDMLQATKQLNMEAEAPNLDRSIPSEDWVQSHRASLPRLDGVCVAIVGPDVSASYDRKLFRFWKAYFTAAGARLDEQNYRNFMPSLSAIRC
jgi:hypothetical protein